MDSPCSCGHFEMRLTSVGLFVQELWFGLVWLARRLCFCACIPLYSILMVTVVHLLNIRSRQHSAQLIKDFYLESRRFVMVRDSAYVVPSWKLEKNSTLKELKHSIASKPVTANQTNPTFSTLRTSCCIWCSLVNYSEQGPCGLSFFLTQLLPKG